MIRDQEIKSIAQLISDKAGYGVNLFSMLHVYALEGEGFVVLETNPLTNEEHEQVFKTAEEAAQVFVKCRHERQLGFDYEKE